MAKASIFGATQMKSWKIGDRAIIINDGYIIGKRELGTIGSECVLLSPATHLLYDWHIDVGGEKAMITSSCLRPIPDEYDGKQVSTWDEMNDKDYIFKPRELVIL